MIDDDGDNQCETRIKVVVVMSMTFFFMDSLYSF